MRRLRLLLLPLGAVAELLVLGTCWSLALPSPRTSKRLMDWATSTLPTLNWYIGE